MATFSKRRNGDGSARWDATVRVVGYPSSTRSFPTKLAAELWAARTEAARRGRSVASARGMTLADLIDDALPRLTHPAGVIFAYWREALGDIRLDRITPELVAQHRDRLLGADCRGYNHKTVKRRSSATVRNYLIELSRLFALAVKELRVMDANPCASVTKPKASAEVVRYLSDDERTALLDACKTSASPDLYPFVLFALTTGARKGEIAALEWAQVDLKRRWATFPRTKNGEARGVPLTTAVCALLESRSRDGTAVFPVDITRAWHTAVARAGIVEFSVSRSTP
jgi:integrase